MTLILITGQSGSGKSTLLQEFKRRNITAYGIDESAIAAHKFKDSGKVFSKEDYNLAKDGKIDWVADTVYEVIPERLKTLSEEYKNVKVFLFGGADNIYNFYDEFKLVFALSVDEQTLKQRLLTRNNGNDYGKKSHELEHVLSRRKLVLSEMKNAGAIIIDGSGSVDKVTEKILSYVASDIQ